MTGPTVAFQGAHGAFGESAVRRRWPDGEPRPIPTFEGVVASVAAGVSDYGVLPVWNSALGEIPFTREALRGAGIRVTDEITVPIELCLLTRPGVTRETLCYVGSHPAALAQCRHYLVAHPTLIPCPVWDTAGAARELMEGPGVRAWFAGLPGATSGTVAAIAGAEAAACYGLAILARGIQDVADNVTRFAILARAGGER
jgi:prephenate dehydratase